MIAAIPFVVLLVAFVAMLNVEHARHRASMTEAERRADDAEYAAFTNEI